MQTSGRAARNAAGKVLFYADKLTRSMEAVINETNRRRETQDKYNKLHGIVPKTIKKNVEEILLQTSAAGVKSQKKASAFQKDLLSEWEIEELVEGLTKEMAIAAEALEFERAAKIRDEISILRGSKKTAIHKKARV